jgi:DNA-cytosine methyltransferase
MDTNEQVETQITYLHPSRRERGAMNKIRVLDLFSGIGGFSLGLERTGHFETVAFCENNRDRWPILKKHWPQVPIIEDVKRIPHGLTVDLVTAGFPCQDISFAGKGAGIAGLRSRLFWRVIRALSLVGWPSVLLENVAALLNRGMGDVLGALAQVGYDAEWNCIPASALGAPHIRDRVFIGANHRGKGSSQKRYKGSPDFRGAKMSEGLRTCLSDPIYTHPNFAEAVMGFPKDWTR